MAEVRKLAKKDGLSTEDFLKKLNRGTFKEYKNYLKCRYEFKECHSFWHSECVNRGIECSHCCHFFSRADWDKMTLKERNYIKNS